jgi:hypothetical protein
MAALIRRPCSREAPIFHSRPKATEIVGRASDVPRRAARRSAMPFTLPFSPARRNLSQAATRARFGDERDRGHRDDPSSSIEPPRSHTDRAQRGRDAERVEDRQQRIERGKARAPHPGGDERRERTKLGSDAHVLQSSCRPATTQAAASMSVAVSAAAVAAVFAPGARSHARRVRRSHQASSDHGRPRDRVAPRPPRGANHQECRPSRRGFVGARSGGRGRGRRTR